MPDDRFPDDECEDTPEDSTIVAQNMAPRRRDMAPAQPCLVVLTGGGHGKVFELDGGEQRLGRADDAELSIPDNHISRYHAAVSRGDDGRIMVRDLGSTNGTFVNGNRLRRRTQKVLRVGSSIQLGPNVSLRLEERAMVKALGSAHSSGVEAQRRALEAELKRGGAIQRGLLPEVDSWSSDELCVAGGYLPAAHCSGDWWWYRVDDGNLTLVIGDVTGHGPGPAMVTAAVAGNFHAITRLGHGDPDAVVEHANASVLDACRGRHWMTMTVARLDVRTGELSCRLAGAPPPYLLKKDGTVEPLLTPPSGPLGSPKLEVGVHDRTLEPGQRLLFYTDGALEIRDARRGFLGGKGLARMLASTSGFPTRDARSQLSDKFVELCPPGAAQDDITFTVVDYFGARS